MNTTPTTDLLDSASLQIIYAEQYAEMLHEIALDLTSSAPVDSHTWYQQDRVNALINAVRTALSTAKRDVDQANTQLPADHQSAFKNDLSSPDAGARKPNTAQPVTQPQEATV